MSRPGCGLRFLRIDPESKFLTSDGYLTVKYRLNVLKRLKRVKIEKKVYWLEVNQFESNIGIKGSFIPKKNFISTIA